MTGYAVCGHCARLRPLHADGTLSTHYLRTGSATATGRRRRRRCPGSRKPPRRVER